MCLCSQCAEGAQTAVPPSSMRVNARPANPNVTVKADIRGDALALLDLHAPEERTEDASVVHALVYIGDQLARIADALALPRTQPSSKEDR